MKHGCPVSFTSHAIMSFLSSNLLTWRWQLLWQGYVWLLSANEFPLVFKSKYVYFPAAAFVKPLYFSFMKEEVLLFEDFIK